MLRHALRAIVRNPGYSIALVLVLALGIGANTAIFSLIDAALFRELPVARPQELVRVFGTDEGKQETRESSYPVYLDYRDQAASFGGLAAHSDETAFHLARNDARAERVMGSVVSGNFFEVLGVGASLGRTILPDDDRPGRAAPVAVLSHQLWRRAFGGDPAVIGATIRLNSAPFTVVGVAPRGFTGTNFESAPDLWVPMGMAATAEPVLASLRPLERRGVSWLFIIGRLKPGATVAQAQAELDAIARRRAASLPSTENRPFAFVSPAAATALVPDQVARSSRAAWLLLGVAGLVLLIACADAAGLLLARAERRHREVAIRQALGATRARVAGHTLLESLILAGTGAVVGLFVAWWLSDLVIAMAPPGFAIPLAAATSVVDGRVLTVTGLMALLCGLLFGAVPAIRRSRFDLAAMMRGEAQSFTIGGRRLTLRAALVGVQVAISAILLVGAGLLLRTLRNEMAVKTGFEPRGAAVASIDLSRQGYDAARTRAFLSRLLERVSATPGVSAAAFAYSVPIQPGGMRTSVAIAGYRPAPDEDMQIEFNVVSPGYYRALGATLLQGREFTAADDSAARPVVIVNQTFAERYFPGQDPLGRTVGDVSNPPAVIVGVIADTKLRSLRETPKPAGALPIAQFGGGRFTLLVRSSLPVGVVSSTLREAAAAIDPDVPIFGIRTLEEKLGLAIAQERVLASLLTAFAALALILSATGLYGIVSYSIESRTRELGVRIALGARARDIIGLVQRQSAMVAMLGLAAGLVVAFLLSEVTASLLFGLTPTDRATYADVAALLAAVCLAAGLMPARRATRVDPMTALRSE
jgi:predicted permease